MSNYCFKYSMVPTMFSTWQSPVMWSPSGKNEQSSQPQVSVELAVAIRIFFLAVWLQCEEIPRITPYPAVLILQKSFTPFNPQRLETEHLLSSGEGLGSSRICAAQVKISLAVMKSITAFANHLADSLCFTFYLDSHLISLRTLFNITLFSVS